MESAVVGVILTWHFGLVWYRQETQQLGCEIMEGSNNDIRSPY
jgi:hypothetical protein